MLDLLALSAALLAPAPTDPAAAPAPSAVKEKKICRGTVNTGSRLPSKRVCRTAAEWEAIDQKASEEAGRAIGASNARNGG